MQRTVFSFGLTLVLAAVTAPVGAEGWPVPRGPSHEPVPYKYDPRQVKCLPRAFREDAPACTFYSGNTYLVEADGSVESITHEIVRFNGRKGIEKLGEYRNASYDPAYQKLTLHVARLHKADGKIVEVQPRHVQLRDVTTDYSVYDHDKQLIISFPNLEVGDAIEVKWSARGKNPEHFGQFFTRYSFGDDRYPVAIDEIRVRIPKTRTLKYATINGKLDPAIKSEGAYRLYHWQAVNLRELPQDEALPSKEELRVSVAVSTFGSWEEVGKWKEKLRADCWKCTAAIRKAVRDVTAGLRTPEEKARALTYWVRRHIRYVSVGVTHDYKPHAPAAVFANRYGDCKDQAQFLAVMLREAGLNVGLVTLGAEDDGQVVESVPSPWGSHAILLVTIDGKEHWIDTTVSQAAWDYLPRMDRGRAVYVTDNKGLRLMRTPTLTPADNRIEQTTFLSVTSDGTSRCRRLATYNGVAAVNQREELTEVPPGERRRQVSSVLQDSNSRARLRRLAIDEKKLKDPDRPVTLGMAFEIPRHFSGTPEMEGSLNDSPVWNKLLRFTIDYDRTMPLKLGIPFESVHHYYVRLPASLKFDSFPKDKTVQSRWGSFHRVVTPDKKDPRVLTLEFRTRLEKTRVEPADFARFRRFHEQVSKDWRAWLTLKPTQDLADAPALETLVALAPDDLASQIILGRLYCDNGRYEKARWVLDWARYLAPNDPKLWELTARATATVREEEKVYREMVKRFPEEPRYLVSLGTTLVKLREHKQARGVLEPVAAKGPKVQRAAAHFQLAHSALAENQPASAHKHLQAAEELDSDTVRGSPAQIFRGQVYEALARSQDALRAYRAAVEVNSEAEEALRALVRLELAAGHRSEALQFLRRYTLAVGNSLQGMVRAADFHLRMQRYEDASELASRALDIRFDVQAQRILGLVYWHRGEIERAVTTLARAEKTADVQAALMRGYVALGKLAEALKVFQAAYPLSDKPGVLDEAGIVMVKLKARRRNVLKGLKVPADKAELWERAAGALVCAEYARKQGRGNKDLMKMLGSAFPGDVEIGSAYSLRGLLYLEGGRLSKALTEAEHALRLSQNDARARYVRGRVRLELGNPGALHDLERAAELGRRQDPAVLHALARALARENRRADALAAAKKALELDPNNQDIQDYLREIEKSGK
jgi:tetratricopeptide (TPR) repeat protein/transglutaminase-like putative cysteine protease